MLTPSLSPLPTIYSSLPTLPTTQPLLNNSINKVLKSDMGLQQQLDAALQREKLLMDMMKNQTKVCNIVKSQEQDMQNVRINQLKIIKKLRQKREQVSELTNQLNDCKHLIKAKDDQIKRLKHKMRRILDERKEFDAQNECLTVIRTKSEDERVKLMEQKESIIEFQAQSLADSTKKKPR